MAQENGLNFEIPAEMRAFAEKSVEQARQAFDNFMTAAQRAVSTAENQAKTTHSGAVEVGELAIKYAEKNMKSSFEFAQKLVHAKDVQQLMALHSEYVKGQISVLSEQAKELGERATKIATPPRTP